MHQRAGGDHEHAARIALVPVGLRLVGGIDLVEVVHADDPHERTERQQTDAVLRLAPTEAPQLRAHEQEELGGLHARPSGRDEVTDLVQEDTHQQAEHEQQRPRAGDAEQDQQRDDAEQADDRSGAAGEVGLARLVAGTAGEHLVAELLIAGLARGGRGRRDRRWWGWRQGLAHVRWSSTVTTTAGPR
ncbi:MAG: hypothetical protein R2713_00315 [Ilumatobacteraceae bacterium]